MLFFMCTATCAEALAVATGTEERVPCISKPSTDRSEFATVEVSHDVRVWSRGLAAKEASLPCQNHNSRGTIFMEHFSLL